MNTDIKLYKPLKTDFMSGYGTGDLLRYVRGNAFNVLFDGLGNKISTALDNTKSCNISDAKYIMADIYSYGYNAEIN